MGATDWPAVAAIYIAGIATGNATFETTVPSWQAWDESHRADLRFVATAGEEVASWPAANRVSDRCCCAGIVDKSVYVAPGRLGRGARPSE